MEESRAIVTGAGSGIGQGIALELGRNGYRVVVHYHSSQAGAEYTCRQIESAGGHAIAVQQDLTHLSGIRNLFDEAAEWLGGLDLFVNNSGITLKAPFSETSEDLFDSVVAVDFKSAYFCIQAAAEIIRRSGNGGNIVIVSSNNAFRQVPGVSVYGSVKAALCKLTRHAAIEYAKDGIRVNCIAPGWTETPRTLSGKRVEETFPEIPLKRWVKPAEIGQIVLFYASPAAQSITGHTIVADGGASLLSDRPESYGL